MTSDLKFGNNEANISQAIFSGKGKLPKGINHELDV